MSKEYQDFELGPDGLEAKVHSVRFLSLDQLEKALNIPGLQVIRMHRSSGKSVMETEGFKKALEAYETKHIIEGQITLFEPHPDKRMLDLLSCRGPGKSERQLEEFTDILWNEWPLTHKPKNTYKPHSFQPAKGEAPRSCKPNPKTVAKNRAKNKAAKAARKKS